MNGRKGEELFLPFFIINKKIDCKNTKMVLFIIGRELQYNCYGRLICYDSLYIWDL